MSRAVTGEGGASGFGGGWGWSGIAEGSTREEVAVEETVRVPGIAFKCGSAAGLSHGESFGGVAGEVCHGVGELFGRFADQAGAGVEFFGEHGQGGGDDGEFGEHALDDGLGEGLVA